MAASSYDEALKRVLESEGGYSNDAGDPGGPTNWGITIFDARMYWKKNATAADVRAMPLSVAKDIYRSKYWAAMRCDDLPAGVDYAVFDYGVNSGIHRAVIVLQRLVGMADDGKIGPLTLAAVQKADPSKLVNQICDERLAFLQRLSTWRIFGKGWGRRVTEVRAAALKMASKVSVAPKTASASASILTTGAALAEPPKSVGVTVGALVVAGGAAIGAHRAGLQPWHIVMIVAGICLSAVAIFSLFKKRGL